jgi:uncharacterized damage-inducible protein DinB
MKQKHLILVQTLKNSPDIIGNYISSIPEDGMNQKRKENFWTIRQHLIHLLQTQKLLYGRILKIKEEDNPVIKPYFPEKDEIIDDNTDIAGLMDKFRTLRDRQLELVEGMNEKDFEKEAVHGEYKKYNLEIILNHMIFHDYWHMYRIEELWLTKDEFLTDL